MKTYEEIEKMFAENKYAFFKGELNLNIFAIRTHVNTNIFDDYIYLVFEQDGKKIVKSYPCTTDAGKYYLTKPMNPNGTAIMVPGQYRGAYAIGKHTSYEALRQIKPIKYWRDNDKDSEHDMSGKIFEEIAFTNIHRASKYNKTPKIDNYSAGCIVIQDPKNFDEMMSLCKLSAKKYGNSFTFTLFSVIN